MSDDSINAGRPTENDSHQGSRFRATVVTSLGIAVVGMITVFLLLATPSVRFPDAESPNHCVRVASWGFNPDGIDVSSDQAGSITRDNCDLSRQERIATAIFVAIPTAIAGSVGMTGLVFRRQLFGPGRGPAQG